MAELGATGGAAGVRALTAKIAAAYVSANPVSATDLPALVATIHETLAGLGRPGRAAPEAAPTPAVPIRRSVEPDCIVCLEDGKRLKLLKRHLRAKYGLTPETYRAKWGLPPDYPMVAPNYAKQRSRFAKKIGLGRRPPAAEAA